MIQKQTWLSIADNTNVKWLQIFHLYKGFFKKQTKIGFFVKGSARVVEPPRIEYKGFKFKFNLKGDICRGLFIRGKYNIYKHDSSTIYFKKNNIILIKKKQDLKSKYLYGPITKMLKRKRFTLLFSTTL
uniref:Ribosomal protein L14 n=1 Tax=Pseudourostyla cristata TaxID=293816 RepID=A0A4P9JLI5_9SPIT|nr:ribosomal protein L14 [Pseudourostyla cristata]